MPVNRFKLSALAAVLLISLTGCNSDDSRDSSDNNYREGIPGQDGNNGLAGGRPGEDGNNGLVGGRPGEDGNLGTPGFPPTPGSPGWVGCRGPEGPILGEDGHTGDHRPGGPIGPGTGKPGPEGPIKGEDGHTGGQGPNGPKGSGPQGPDGPTVTPPPGGGDMTRGNLVRLMTMPTDGKITGLHINDNGNLLFNLHSPEANGDVDGITFDRGTLGVVHGLDFNNLESVPESLNLPSSNADRHAVVVTGEGHFQTLAQSGDNGLGEVTGIGNDPVEFAATNSPSASVLMPHPTKPGKQQLLTAWDSVPAGISRLTLTPSGSDWQVTNTQMLDLSPNSLQGTGALASGQRSPWGTLLASENEIVIRNTQETTSPTWNQPENNDSSHKTSVEPKADLMDQWLGQGNFPNPYRYGYTMETTFKGDDIEAVKHFAMGRFKRGGVAVMPDQRTVYMVQSDAFGVIYKFVADYAGDLSSGNLYAARVMQDGPLGATNQEPRRTGFTVDWIHLAHGTQNQIESWVQAFDKTDLDDFYLWQSSYFSNMDAEAWAAGYKTFPDYGDRQIPVDDRIAFLETAEAARLKGATAEWRNLQGLTVNLKRAEKAVDGTGPLNKDVSDAYVYFTSGQISRSMTDSGHIRLRDNVNACSGLYGMRLEANYDVRRIEPILMGGNYDESKPRGERCSPDLPSQMTEVKVLDDGRLLIAEGEAGIWRASQENRSLWLYQPNDN